MSVNQITKIKWEISQKGFIFEVDIVETENQNSHISTEKFELKKIFP